MANWPIIIDRNVAQPSRVRLSNAPEAGSDVYDVTPVPGTVVNDGTVINKNLFDTIHTYVDDGSMPVIPITSTDGIAYTGTIDADWAQSLSGLAGHMFTVIPNRDSANTTVMLSINGLDAKPIRRKSPDGTMKNMWSNTWMMSGISAPIVYSTFGSTFVSTLDTRPNGGSDFMNQIDIGKGGTGATTALGAANGLQVWGIGNRTGIPSGADLNSYTTPGNYSTGGDATAKTVLNTPHGAAASTDTVAFNLTVTLSLGGSPDYLRQVYEEWTSLSKYRHYERTTLNRGTTWGNWIPTYDANNLPAFQPLVEMPAGTIPWATVAGAGYNTQIGLSQLDITGNSVVRRAAGNVRVATTPLDGNDATSKSYVDFINKKGTTLTNLIRNGDFSNGSVGWVSVSEPITVANNISSMTAIAQYRGMQQSIMAKTKEELAGHTLYTRAMMNVYSTEVKLIIGNDGTNQTVVTPSAANKFVPVSGLRKISSAPTIAPFNRAQDYNESGWGLQQTAWWVCIDLTDSFGAGNEPTAAQMDALLAANFENSWFDGTVTLGATGNIVAGENVTITGELKNRLLGDGDVTINATGGGSGGDVTYPITVDKGGTGATTAFSALNNLRAPSLVEGIAIVSGADLNTYLTPGTYRSEGSAVTTTLLNKPSGALINSAGFILYVTRPRIDSALVNQFLIGNGATTALYTRHTANAGGTWGPWYEIYTGASTLPYQPLVDMPAGTIPWATVAGAGYNTQIGLSQGDVTGNSVVRRAAGNVRVATTPLDGNDATSKSYVDTALNNKQGLVNIQQDEVLARTLSGVGPANASFKVTNSAATENSIPRYAAGGALFAGTPTNGSHAATKSYVDTLTDYSHGSDSQIVEVKRLGTSLFYVKANVNLSATTGSGEQVVGTLDLPFSMYATSAGSVQGVTQIKSANTSIGGFVSLIYNTPTQMILRSYTTADTTATTATLSFLCEADM